MLVTEADEDSVREACHRWFGGGRAQVTPLDGAGFSGSRLMRVRVEDRAADVVLKSFPAAARGGVRRVHALMAHLREAGCHEVPDVVPAADGETLVAGRGDVIWEAVRFVPGITTTDPSPDQARAAAAVLARIHVAAARWPLLPPRRAVPACVVRRKEAAGRLATAPWESWPAPAGPLDPLVVAVNVARERAAAIVREAAGGAVLHRVEARRPAAMRVHAALRDVWSSHVIFAAAGSATVAGIVDFQAAAIDSPATDLARLLGSWTRWSMPAALAGWEAAMEAYEAIRSLTDEERSLVPWLAATGVVFALDNWFRWVLQEGRKFAGPVRVVERVDRLVDDLGGALAWLDGRGREV